MDKDFVHNLEILNKLVYVFVHFISFLVGWEGSTKLVQDVEGPSDIKLSTVGLHSPFVSGFKEY